MKLWSHGEVYGLIQKAGLDHYLVPDLTSRKKKKKCVRISSKLYEFPFQTDEFNTHALILKTIIPYFKDTGKFETNVETIITKNIY